MIQTEKIFSENIECHPNHTAITGTPKASHSAQMSPSVQPLPQCEAPSATIAANGFILLDGVLPSFFAFITLCFVASLPKWKYLQTQNTVPNKAVTGQTTFIIHMCCGWRNSSAIMITAQTVPRSSEASDKWCSHSGTKNAPLVVDVLACNNSGAVLGLSLALCRSHLVEFLFGHRVRTSTWTHLLSRSLSALHVLRTRQRPRPFVALSKLLASGSPHGHYRKGEPTGNLSDVTGLVVRCHLLIFLSCQRRRWKLP